MFRLLIILSPRLNEATRLVVAHDCSVWRGLPGPDYWISQPITSVTFYPCSDFSISKHKHFIGGIICGAIFNEINFLDDEGLASSDITLFVSFLSSAWCNSGLKCSKVGWCEGNLIHFTWHSIQLWCAGYYNIIICIRPVYQPCSPHVSHLIYESQPHQSLNFIVSGHRAGWVCGLLKPENVELNDDYENAIKWTWIPQDLLLWLW